MKTLRIITILSIFLVCEDCESMYRGDCPVHGPLLQFEPLNGFDECSKQHTSVPVPAELRVKPSSIAGAGLGVFTNKFLPKGVRFGPYVGKVVDKNEMEDVHDTSYVWEVCM